MNQLRWQEVSDVFRKRRQWKNSRVIVCNECPDTMKDIDDTWLCDECGRTFCGRCVEDTFNCKDDTKKFWLHHNGLNAFTCAYCMDGQNGFDLDDDN